MRHYKQYRKNMAIIALATRCVARKFLALNMLDVAYLERNIIINMEHQSRCHYKSNHHKLPFLKISWGKKE